MILVFSDSKSHGLCHREIAELPDISFTHSSGAASAPVAIDDVAAAGAERVITFHIAVAASS